MNLRKTLLISLGVLVIAVLAAFIVGSRWFNDFLASREFVQILNASTGSALNADAAYDPLRWTGSSAYSERLSLQGRAGAALKSLEARQLRADVNWRAAFQGAWRIEELSVASVEGEIVVPQATGTPEAPQPAPPEPSSWPKWLPQRFEMGRLSVARTSLRFGEASVEDVALSIAPEGDSWTFNGSGGHLRAPRLPEMKIDDFRARHQKGDFFLTESHLRLGESGKIEASGASSDGGSLRVEWQGVNVQDLLASEWKNRLFGLSDGLAVFRSSKDVSGNFLIHDGRVENVHVLEQIATFTGNPAFRRLPLQELSAGFSYKNGEIALDNLVAESKGLLRVEGNVRISEKGGIAGVLEIGVTPQTLQWLPGSRERVFTKARNGYVWAPLRVTGTIEHPEEDLSKRLAAAMGEAVIEGGTDLIKSAPGEAVEGVRNVLDALRPLIP